MTDVRVLGPVQVSTGDGLARLRPREAAVVAALALGDRPLHAADIAELIWSTPPASALGAVRNHVSKLRRSMGRIESVGSGYRFESAVRVDARTLESVATRARAGDLDGAPAEQAATLRAVRASWRGGAFGELVSHPRVIAARDHLDGLRSVIDEELAAALLDAGQTERAHLLLENLVVESPRRSRRWSLLALACFRLGRRDDALVASMRANDFRTDTGGSDDEQLVRIFRDDPVLLTVTARRVTRRAVPIVGVPVDSGLRRYPLVGRDGDLARLATAVDEAASIAAPSHLLVVEGEPGIGKTMFAYRSATDASGRGLLALWGWCDLAPTDPFAALGRLVQDLVAALGAEVVGELAGDDLPVLVDLVPEAEWDPGQDGTGGAPTAVARDAALRVLAAAASQRPIVCVVDDVQWAQPSTVGALLELAASDAPIALVVVGRLGHVPAEFEVEPERKVVLTELDVDAVREYLRGALDFEPDAELTELIWSRAGGHPLLLLDIVESIEPSASPESVYSLASGEELPRSVADGVARRLAELSPSALLAVSAASVLGPSFSPPLLADMIDLDDDALAEATAAGIITPESRRGRARFRHELVRAAVYDSLPSLERAQFHESAGKALERRGVPRWNAVAFHFVASAELDPRRAAIASRRAGREATKSFSFAEAAEHHRLEVELLELARETEIAPMVDALTDQGAAMLRSGDPEVVGVLMRAAQMARDSGDLDRLARVMTDLCDVGPASQVGAPAPEIAELLELALAGAQERDTVARLSASASYHYSMSGDWERCRSLYDHAIEMGSGSRVMAEVLPFAAVVLGGPDDLGRRGAAADELDLIAVQDRDPLARAEALYVRIGVQLQLADPRFRSTLDEMIQLETVASAPGIRWSIAYLTAAREHIDGHLGASERAAAEAFAPQCRGVAESRRLAGYGAQVVALRLDDDRIEELIPELEGFVAEQPTVAAWRAVLAGALARVDPIRSRAEFDRFADVGFATKTRDFSWTAAMVVLTSGMAVIGDAERARTAYEALGRFAGRMSWSGSCTFGPVDQALGEAAAAFGDEASAKAHFRRAAEVAARLGAPRMLARARAGSAPRLPGRAADGIVN